MTPSGTITRSRFYEESGITADRLRRVIDKTEFELPRPVFQKRTGNTYLRKDWSAWVASVTCEDCHNEKTIEMMMVWLEDFT